MAPDFPPRTRTKPILHNERMNQGNGTLEIEVEQKDEVEMVTRRG